MTSEAGSGAAGVSGVAFSELSVGAGALQAPRTSSDRVNAAQSAFLMI